MVSIEDRKNEDLTVTYRVRWRQGGHRPTVTFCTGDHGPRTAMLAERFRTLVRLNGETWPTREQLDPFGLGFVLADDSPTPVPGVLTVAQLIEDYITWRTQPGHAKPPISPATAKTYRRHLGFYIAGEPLGGRDVTDPDLTWRDVQAWQHEVMTVARPGGRKPLGANTVNGLRHDLIDAAFRWACSPHSGPEGAPLRTAPNPCTDMPVPQTVDPPVRDILTGPADYAALIAATSHVDKDFAAAAIATAAFGTRISETVLMAPDCVDVPRRLALVDRHWDGIGAAPGGKDGRSRWVPVPDAVMEHIVVPRLERGGPLLFAGPRGGRWRSSTLSNRWADTRVRLATHHSLRLALTNHCLRHSYITYLESADISTSKVRLIVGHATKDVHGRYVQLTESDRTLVRALLDPLFGTLTANL